jgi:hypothetical protein
VTGGKTKSNGPEKRDEKKPERKRGAKETKKDQGRFLSFLVFLSFSLPNKNLEEDGTVQSTNSEHLLPRKIPKKMAKSLISGHAIA